MPRPTKPKDYKEVVLSLRVDKKLVDELDAIAATLVSGITLSRAQLVKRALREWLDSHKHSK
jgi:metal-responsive CopG/Arc/MetJ family transcriptional regulator